MTITIMHIDGYGERKKVNSMRDKCL